jgi:hypothetical protein
MWYISFGLSAIGCPTNSHVTASIVLRVFGTHELPQYGKLGHHREGLIHKPAGQCVTEGAFCYGNILAIRNKLQDYRHSVTEISWQYEINYRTTGILLQKHPGNTK